MTTEPLDSEFVFSVWPKDTADEDARIYQALTPHQAAERRAREDYDGTSDWRRNYRVRCHGTRELYEAVVSVVPQPTFEAIVRKALVQPATHVLWGGAVLCDNLRPGAWPDGHKWISFKSVEDGAPAPPDACEACWTKATRAVQARRETLR